MVVGVASKQARIASASNLFPFNGPESCQATLLVVHLASAPLLRNGLVLVQDVGRHVVQVLFLFRGCSGNGLFKHPKHQKYANTKSYFTTTLHIPDTSLICQQVSCCFMVRILDQMSPPLMDGWTSEMSCQQDFTKTGDISKASVRIPQWAKLYVCIPSCGLEYVDWAPETKKQSGSGNNTCRNKLYTSLTHTHTHTDIYI